MLPGYHVNSSSSGTGCKMLGSSFITELSRVDIGHFTIRSLGNGLSRSRGSGSSHRQRAAACNVAAPW
jgi:hypothetical protein